MAVQQDSDFFSPRTPSLLSIIAYRIADFVDQGAISLRNYIIRSQTERALGQLSDRQLDDIGIKRTEIASVSAKAAAYFSG